MPRTRKPPTADDVLALYQSLNDEQRGLFNERFFTETTVGVAVYTSLGQLRRSYTTVLARLRRSNTQRTEEVFALKAQGKTRKDIAKQLGISIESVDAILYRKRRSNRKQPTPKPT